MKRCQHSIYYDTSVESYLHYDGQAEMAAYSEAAAAVDQLPLDHLVLLKHFRELARFTEDLVQQTYERMDGEDAIEQAESPMVRAIMEAERQQQHVGGASAVINLPAMLGVAWYWHKLVRQRKCEMTGLYAHALFLSWSSYCKLFHLYVVSDRQRHEALQTATADQFVYCRFASEETNAVVSNAPVLQYTISEVWAAVRRIVPSLYQHAFHASMKIYVHALFFRYCDLFCSAPPSDPVALAHVLDHPLFCAPLSLQEEQEQARIDIERRRGAGTATVHDPHEHYDSYRAVQVRLDAQHVLKSEYFYEGELLFFFQLVRLRLSEQLVEQHAAQPLVLEDGVPSSERLDDTEAQMMAMLRELVVHPYIKKYIIEQFKRTVMSIYLYHGERERYQRRNPTAASEPNDVLTVCRPNDHMTAVAMQKATLRDILDKPQEFEREVVLVAKHATHQWLKMEEVKQHAAIAASFVVEEMEQVERLEQLVTDNELDQQQHNEGALPVLLKLVNVYYVLYRGAVYRSVRFAESYLVWLALLIRASQAFGPCDVHQRIRDALQYFVPLL